MRLVDVDMLDVLTIIGGRMDGKVEFAKAVNEMIQNAPTVDAVPVRHGHWIFNPKDAIEMMFTLPKCSECGAESADGGNFCPNCGARMDKGREDDNYETNR